MTNKKLTDKEIIKALESLTNGCFGCNDGCKEDLECPVEAIKATLDLINRQKAYNDMLESLNETNSIMIHELNKSFENIKTNAYKEFAEKLKEKFEPLNSPLLNNRIDNLLKEMVGE